MIVCLLPIPTDASRDVRAAEALSAPQRARLASIGHPARARQHLWSRTLYNAFMATVDVTNPEEFPRDRAHPPLVTGAGLVFTSISHTDGWVALGASDIPDASRSSASSAPPASPVAIDIEPMRPRANWRALAEYAFDDETVTLIAATSDPLTAFYAEWVAYESRIKYPKPERDDWYAAWGRVGASVEEQPRMATRVFEADPYPLMVGTLSSTPPRYVTGEALLDVFPQLRRLLG